ncbi:unnamed protein product [Arabis nemorensis]|uniref:Uncharacterized protein n=1 Tax=Arabis nemorensis TaxID=586526 RepID=A0A565CNU6_9BRAS|nr:unnamed protein product [Arabis nemorensis]
MELHSRLLRRSLRAELDGRKRFGYSEVSGSDLAVMKLTCLLPTTKGTSWANQSLQECLWSSAPLVKSDGDSMDRITENSVRCWIKVDANLRLFLVFVPSRTLEAACVSRPFRHIST